MTTLITVAATAGSVALTVFWCLFGWSAWTHRTAARERAVEEHNRAVMWNHITGHITHEERDVA